MQSLKPSARHRASAQHGVTCGHRAGGTALCPQLAGPQPDMRGGPPPRWAGPRLPGHEGSSQQLGRVAENQNPGPQGSVFQFLFPTLAKFCWEKPLLAGTCNPEVVLGPGLLHPACLQCVDPPPTEPPTQACASGEPRTGGLAAWTSRSAGLGLNPSLNRHAAPGKLLSFSAPQSSPRKMGAIRHPFPSFRIDSGGIG